MKTIHKYVLTDSVNKVSTFERAKFIHVANQREQITVWAEVNTLGHERMVTLHIVGTGGEVPAGGRHIGSALLTGGDYVFHVYTTPAPTPAHPSEEADRG